MSKIEKIISKKCSKSHYKKIIIVCFFLLTYLNSFCQEKFYKTQIAFGLTTRSSIKYKNSHRSTNYYPFTYELFINSRPIVLSIDFKKQIYKDKISIQLSNYITYGLLKRGGDSNYYFNDNSLRKDHFIDILYSKSIKKKSTKIVVGVGYGIMNVGTDFIFNGEYNGNPYNISIPGTLRFFAPRLTVGLEKGIFNGFIIANYTGRDELYNKVPAFNLDGKLTVTFPKFKKINWRRKK